MLKSLRTLCKQLGYIFQEISWLELALTHRSYNEQNNERLEFLGDALLNFCIAEKLFNQHPDYSEGDLSRLRANLVNGEVLATLAKELSVNEYIRLGVGELKSGGLERKSILANTMEAVIGALYLDGGIEVCQQRVNAWYSDSFIKMTSRGVTKDPKTQLQEHVQARKIALPIYRVLSVEGRDHSQVFRVECSIAMLSKTAVGAGSSRKRAEQDAAEKLLEQL